MNNSIDSFYSIIYIDPERIFKGDIYQYGLLYPNSFDKQRKIIWFEDIVQYLETVYYTVNKNSSKESNLIIDFQPFWKSKMLINNEKCPIQQITKVTSKKKNIEAQKDDIRIFGKHGYLLSRIENKKFLFDKIIKKKKERKQDDRYTKIEEMVLLNKNVFQDNPDFQLNYIINHIDCVYSVNGDYNCMKEVVIRDTLNLMYTVENDLDYSKNQFENQMNQLYDLLQKNNNPRILYKSLETSLHNFKETPIFEPNRAEEDPFGNQNDEKFHPDQKINNQTTNKHFSITPTLFSKQINYIVYYFKEYYIVQSKKKIISIYDKNRNVLFYAYEIKEEYVFSTVTIYNNEYFSVQLKKKSDDKEYFKFLLFKFKEAAMTIRLVNPMMRLIHFVDNEIVINEFEIFVIFLKKNYFGLAIYRFDILFFDDAFVKGKGYSVKKDYGLLQKIPIHEFFLNPIVIDNFKKKISSAKIGCQIQLSRNIFCVIQYKKLDSIFLLLDVNNIESLYMQRTMKDMNHKNNTVINKIEKVYNKSRILMQKKYFKKFGGLTKNNGQSRKKRYLNNYLKKLKKIYTQQKQELKMNRNKADSSMKQNRHLILKNIKLIKNMNNIKFVHGYQNYFRNETLILLYKVETFIRIYFYKIPLIEMIRQKYDHESKTYNITPINMCEIKDTKNYIGLFYRVEIPILFSKFLNLSFSYDIEKIGSKESLLSVKDTYKKIHIMKVVFNNRVETYRINEFLKIFAKNRTIQYNEIKIFAKNYFNSINAKG